MYKSLVLYVDGIMYLYGSLTLIAHFYCNIASKEPMIYG